jgi:AAA+ superfamily predicted ATPase
MLEDGILNRTEEMGEYLLGELEAHDGVVVFATNMAATYDPAFERRLTMHIPFSLPTDEEAHRILEKLLPAKSRAEDVDPTALSLSGLSGGDLKNIVLNAAALALVENAPKIKQAHLVASLGTARCRTDQQGPQGYMI